MNENDWEKGIRDLKEIRLSREEKQTLLSRVLGELPSPVIRSTWLFGQLTFVRRHVVSFAILLLILVGGGATFASERAVPGNILYPLKIDVNEPIRGFIKTLPDEKIEWQAEKAGRRIEEAEILIDRDKLDEQKKEQIEALFEEHTQTFKEEAEKKIERQIEEEKDSVQMENQKKESEKIKEQIEKRIEDLEKAKNKAFEVDSYVDGQNKDRSKKKEDKKK